MKKILIIEDDTIVAHVYRSRLEKEGFEVDIAADGQAGYYRLYEMKPDALLLDLMLPKLNGIDLLKKIRATREFAKLAGDSATTAMRSSGISAYRITVMALPAALRPCRSPAAPDSGPVRG